MPSTLSCLAVDFDAVSPVSIAVIATDFVSAMNRMPLGPKASGPIDLNCALPCFMPAVRSGCEAGETSGRDNNAARARRVVVFIWYVSLDRAFDRWLHLKPVSR